MAFLRDHALQGRLTNDELEERIGLAYSAVTMGDLESLIGDLPRPHAPARRQHHRPHRQRRHEPTPGLIVAGIAVLLFTGVPLIVGAAVVALVAVVFALSFVLGPLILVALLIMAAARRNRRPPPMRFGHRAF